MTTATTSLTVTKLGSRVGARIDGVRLTAVIWSRPQSDRSIENCCGTR
jgi:hypothetical protein